MALTRVPVFLAFQALFSFQDAVRCSVFLAVLSARLSDSLFIIPHLCEFVKRFLKSFFKSFSFSRMSFECPFLTSTSSCVPSGMHRISRYDAVFVASLECPLDRRLVYYSTFFRPRQVKRISHRMSLVVDIARSAPRSISFHSENSHFCGFCHRQPVHMTKNR